MKKLRVTVNGKAYDVTVEVLEDEKTTAAAMPESVQSQHAVKAPVKESASPQLPAESGDVLAPMTGVILRCEVKEGDSVTIDQPLLVLEAMKMESVIPSPLSGTVASLNVKAGEAVQEGQILLKIE